MKPLTLSLLAVMLAEAGAAMIMLNATPHQPLGFWLWFGGLAAFSPMVGFWIYRRLKQQEANAAEL